MPKKSASFLWVTGLLAIVIVLLLIGLGGGMLLGQRWLVEETAVPTTSRLIRSTPTSTALSALPTISVNPVTIPPPSPPTISLSPTPSPLPLPSPTPSPSPMPVSASERQVMGYSGQRRPIELVRLGHGERWFVLIGAMHGGTECNTSGVIEGIIKQLVAEPTLLPDDATIYAVPLINQDGCAANTRGNANGVDLNRNWNTPDWQADAEASNGINIGSGGSQPFSEPETQLLRDWLLDLQTNAPTGSLVVISYHSAVPQTGLVQPGYIRPGEPGLLSDQLARHYSETTGYFYSATWVGNYAITGEFIYWANLQNIVAMDVELPDREVANTIPTGRTETHIETNLRGLLSVINISKNNAK